MAQVNNFHGMMTTNKEFFKQACRWKDSTSIQTAAEWWSAFQEVIIREVFYNGCCRVPGLGTFTIKEEESHYTKQRMPNGKEVTYLVPGRIIPIFTPEDDFINDVNMQGVTKKYRKRLKQGALTERDYTRQVRADSLAASACVDEMVEQRREKAQQEFQKLLKTKRELKEQANEATKDRTNAARAVVQMDLEGKVIAIYPSMTKAEEATGINKIYISNCCDPLRRQKTAGGYKWKYAERQEIEKENVNGQIKQSEDSNTKP